MWLFLLRSAMEMASSSLPSRSAPATCWTKIRDCFRAAEYIRKRSIITPKDQTESMNSRTMTPLATHCMLCHMPGIDQLVPWSCNINIHTARFASIESAPFFFLQNIAHVLTVAAIRPLHPLLRNQRELPPARAACFLTPTQLEIQFKYALHLHRSVIQHRRMKSPLFHGVNCGLHQHRRTRHIGHFNYFSVFINQRV